MTDKPLPQALDAEQAILGTCLCYPDSILEISSVLKPDMFYLESNKQLYIAIQETAVKLGSADLVSVTEYLRSKEQLEGFGGVLGLTKRTENVVSNSNLINYAYLVREKYILRQYIFSGHKLSEMAYSDDLHEVVEYAEKELFNISTFTQSKEPKHISRCVDQYLIEIEKIKNHKKLLSGIASGFTSIDRITGGWQPKDLIILAGRTSMGKTAMALQLAKGSAENNFPVAIFSLEMSEEQLTGRYLSGISGKSNMELRAGKVDLMKLGEDSEQIASLPIYIDDTPMISLFEMRSKVKKLIVQHGIQIIVVDYLQLMSGDKSKNSREQEVSSISRGLKAIAKEFNIPVIALSQLNRGTEDHKEKKPMLSDLRESGAIEQDADIVAFVYRPAYYGLKTADVNGDEYSSQGLMIFDIAKNRNGACIALPLKHNEALTEITDFQKVEECTF